MALCPRCDCINCDECGNYGCICNAPIRYSQADLDKAVADEREACVQCVYDVENEYTTNRGWDDKWLVDEFVDRIRSRGTEPKEVHPIHFEDEERDPRD